MKIIISKTPQQLGEKAAALTAQLLNKAIEEKGYAKIVLSTGASQFTTLEALINEKVDWSKVDMFHLDEYIGIDETHPASFIRYLKERFTSKVSVRNAYFLDTSHGVKELICDITPKLRSSPVDVGLIGIGENAHIAFNDPPADFEDPAAYKIITPNDRCRQQQVSEGWFKSPLDMPQNAVSMTVKQILSCKSIISSVPYACKAKAVYDTLTSPISNMVPATIMRNHPDFTLFLDEDSSSLLSPEQLV